MKNNELLIFYDADCGLCNYWVQFCMNRDMKRSIFYSPLRALGQVVNSEIDDPESILVQSKGQWLKGSDAILEILRHLGFSSLVIEICMFIPVEWRDFVYRRIARNRRVFKTNSCRYPSTLERQQFLFEVPAIREKLGDSLSQWNRR